MTALEGYDPRDPLSLDETVDYVGATRKSIKDFKIAYSPDFDVYPIDPKIAAVVKKAVEAFADAGAHVEVHSRGLRVSSPAVMARMAAGERVEPSAYYMRTALRFETAAPDLQWLVGRLAVGFGERLPDLVRLTVCAVA